MGKGEEEEEVETGDYQQNTKLHYLGPWSKA
jgi:hypothetical protein